MNPYSGVIYTLLLIQLLSAALIMFQTKTIKRQFRENASSEPGLRRVRTLRLMFCLSLFATTLFFIHKNSVQNRIYFENAQKQIQINAQNIADMGKRGR